MITEIRIPVDGEQDIVLAVDYDKPCVIADMDKLDADLELISSGKLSVALPADTYDYTYHEWESPKGKMIGELFALVDAGVEF